MGVVISQDMAAGHPPMEAGGVVNFGLPLTPSRRNIERNCIEGDFMIGKTLSHYKVLEKIGEGDMGGVYWAEDTNFSELVR